MSEIREEQSPESESQQPGQPSLFAEPTEGQGYGPSDSSLEEMCLAGCD